MYLIWSVLESSARADASRITLYAVLLVSVLDAFLLRITAFSGFMAIRWAGVAILAAGCSLRIASLKAEGSNSLSRSGRALQMVGLALGSGFPGGNGHRPLSGNPVGLQGQIALKALVQRVSRAEVTVNGRPVGMIGKGPSRPCRVPGGGFPRRAGLDGRQANRLRIFPTRMAR